MKAAGFESLPEINGFVEKLVKFYMGCICFESEKEKRVSKFRKL